jgi:hypothetical protein
VLYLTGRVRARDAEGGVRCREQGRTTALIDDVLEVEVLGDSRPRLSAGLIDASTTFLANLPEGGDTTAQLAAAEQSFAEWGFLIASGTVTWPTAAHWVIFKEPAKTDVQHLVHFIENQRSGFNTWMGPENHRRRRDGRRTDPRCKVGTNNRISSGFVMHRRGALTITYVKSLRHHVWL